MMEKIASLIADLQNNLENVFGVTAQCDLILELHWKN